MAQILKRPNFGDPTRIKAFGFDFIASLLPTLIICLIANPGFMSYDSLHMVEEARGEIKGGIYPTAPVYLFRIFDIFHNGNFLLWISQVFFFYFSANLLLKNLGASKKASWTFSLFSIVFSFLFGSLLVLWKDVTMTSFFLSATALLTCKPKSRQVDNIYTSVASILIIAGSTMRLNGLIIAIPLLILWARKISWAKSRLAKSIAAVIMVFVVLFINLFLATFRLPDLNRLEPSTNWLGTQTYDLVGISHYSREPILPIGANVAKNPMSSVDAVFSPLGALEMNTRIAKLDGGFKLYENDYKNEDITRTWISKVTQHPLEYLRYRFDLFGEILGLTDHQTFEPTHYGMIDANDFGIKISQSTFTYLALAYVYLTSSSILGKPWLLLAVSLCAFTFALQKKKIPVFEVSLIGSAAILYLFSFLFLTATGEVRYFFPTGSYLLVILVLGLDRFRKSKNG